MTPGLAGKTMVIQGLGNVGSFTGLISQDEGDVKVIGVTEYEGAIHNPNGIDIDKLIKFRKETGSILNFPGTKTLKTREAGLELACDILSASCT